MEKLGYKVIDCHAHVGRIPGRVGYVVTGDDLDFVLKSEGVSFALASSASVTTVGQKFGNAEAVREVGKHLDTVGGMVWINPHDPSWEEDAEATLAHGFLGVKLHPTFDLYKVGVESLGSVFSFAVKHGLSILTHAMEREASPSNYAELLERYPDVKVVFAHFGPEVDGILMAKQYDNAYLDTTLTPPSKVAVAVTCAGSGKVLFGTDSPLGYKTKDGPDKPEYRTFRRATDEIIKLGLREAELEDVFYRNSIKVFSIRLKK